MSILAIKRLTQRFGGLVAVKELDFAVESGSIVAMIGPNGAGKSTVFNLITGIYKPTEGGIEFDGAEIQGRSTSAIAARRYRAHVSKHPALRVHVGARQRDDRRACADACHAGWTRSCTRRAARKEERRVRERAHELLTFVGLEQHAAFLCAQSRLRPAAATRDRSRARGRAEAFACSTSPPPG